MDSESRPVPPTGPGVEGTVELIVLTQVLVVSSPVDALWLTPRMPMPSLYEYLATPALDMSRGVVTARTASVEEFDPSDTDLLHAPQIYLGTSDTKRDAETFDDDPAVDPLSVPASEGTEMTHSDGENFDWDLALSTVSAPTATELGTIDTRSDNETYDDDPGLGGLGLPS